MKNQSYKIVRFENGKEYTDNGIYLNQEVLVECWRDELTFEQIAVRMGESILKIRREMRRLCLID